MTSVEQDIDNLRRKKKKQKLNKKDLSRVMALSATFANMNFIFANVINESQNGPSASAYHDLLEFCGPNDTFITFNWDTLLDRALADTGGWTPKDGYGVSFSSIFDSTWRPTIEYPPCFPTKWKLLKLHGSTNWLVPYTTFKFETLEYESLVSGSEEVFLFWQSTLPYETHRGRWRGGYAPTCYGYYPPNLPVGAFSPESISAPPGHVWITANIGGGIFCPFKEPSADGVPSSPLLITPVRQKRYDMYVSAIESLWQQATKATTKADRIVIIGYSFPPTDTRPLEMLRNVLDSRKGEISVEIVAPRAKDIASRIGNDHLSKARNVILHPVYFEDYIEILGEGAPQLMKSAAERFRKVKDWLERIYGFNVAGQSGLLSKLY